MKLTWPIHLGYEVPHRKSQREESFELTYLNPLAVKSGFKFQHTRDLEHDFRACIKHVLVETERLNHWEFPGL
jgi:hypothetical protein